jgi:hypothetical protein
VAPPFEGDYSFIFTDEDAAFFGPFLSTFWNNELSIVKKEYRRP